MNPRKDLRGQMAVIQKRHGNSSGKQYWRSLEELAENVDFEDLMRREFPEQAAVWPDALSRRRFLTFMGASLALAGLNGCSVKPAPSKEIVPAVRPPEQSVPGRPLFYATTMAFAGNAVGLLVESHMGRPTKVEGNPQHPASLGATDIFNQASVLTLYDPERSSTVMHVAQTRTWAEALAALREAIDKQRERRGAGLRVLTEGVVSPTLAQQLENLLTALPEAKWHVYEPVSRDMASRGAKLAFGQVVNSVYNFQKADVVVSLDADFLTCGPGNLRCAAQFMSRRRVRTTRDDAAKAEMNRLYAIETNVSSTGAKADHRLAVRFTEIENLARMLATRVGIPAEGKNDEAHGNWISAVAKDLEAHRGRSLVLAGDRQPPVVHLLAHALNDRLGNVGQTVVYTDPVEARSDDRAESLRSLVDDMQQGRVECLLILGGNPVYSAPADIPFTQALERVPLRVRLGLYQDETSLLCHWHLPEAHYLETWGDALAYDGTASITQPLVMPLYQGRSALELVSFLIGGTETPSREIVRDYWRKHWEEHDHPDSFETFWDTALHEGVISGTAFPAKSVSLQDGWQKHLQADAQTAKEQSKDTEGFELVFQPDPTIYDGSFANNGWLQELPKPITKLTWGNAALMSPTTARQLGIEPLEYAHGGEHGGYQMPVVELKLDGRSVQAPAWIVPGHADRSITVYLGYGREQAGKLGGSATQPLGFNAYKLRTSAQTWFASGLQVTKTDSQELVACTQSHHLMENRDLVQAATLAQYRDKSAFNPEPEKTEEPELPPRPSIGGPPEDMPGFYSPLDEEIMMRKWGMCIDLTACVACQACVVACQAENNIPVVGKEQVAFGREMHWLRIDRYLHGPLESPEEFYFQPVPCMHCEQAPCEYVCPTEATVHSSDGLNEQIYQRCVGTRFCSNNCSYKVRRFNFLHYADFETTSRRFQYNPDVTVRSRGVMEKCTYCVQRIREVEISSQEEGRRVLDGEILTACQAACPTQAIVFGDMNDPDSKVKQYKDSPIGYSLLAELNTVPRTTYLAALRNPNPEIEAP